MRRNFSNVLHLILTIVISQSISTSLCCIEGSNLNLDAVVELSTNGIDLLANVSKFFSRISLDANDITNPDFNSQFLLEVAKANSQSSNFRNVTVTAALRNSDLSSFKQSLDYMLSKIADWKRINPGTITGLIVTSVGDEALHNLPDIFKNKNTLQIIHYVVANVKKAVQEIQAVSTIIRLAQTHPERRGLPLGIRSGYCEYLEKIFSFPNVIPIVGDVKKGISGILDTLDFIICGKLPLANSKQQDSAASIKIKMNGIIKSISKRWPSLKVTIETGWPAVGQAINEIEGSISSIKKFWCEIDQWSKENSILVDFYSGFNAKDPQNPSMDPANNRGWRTRILNELTGYPNLIDKMKFNSTEFKFQANSSSPKDVKMDVENFSEINKDVELHSGHSIERPPEFKINARSSTERSEQVEVHATNSSKPPRDFKVHTERSTEVSKNGEVEIGRSSDTKQLNQISRSVSGIHGCIDGDNKNLGAVVKPYKKNSSPVSDTSQSEIANMVKILSKEFTRISLYASDDTNSIDSHILAEIAKANSENGNGPNITVIAAVQASDDISYKKSLNTVLGKIAESNRIHPGTVTGLIVINSYIKELQNFGFEDILLKSDSYMQKAITLFSKINTPRKDILEITSRVETAKNHPNARGLQIGIRSENCADVENKMQSFLRKIPLVGTVHSHIEKMYENLDFLICRQLPSSSSSPQQSAEDLINKVDKTIRFFKETWPKLDVIVETGWPTDGKVINGIIGSVSSMNQFWCKINEWSKDNSIKVDFYTAFDGTKEKVSGRAPATNYGWWIRILDRQSGLPHYVEKINYNSPGSPERSFPEDRTSAGFRDDKRPTGISSSGSIIVVPTIPGCLSTLTVVVGLLIFLKIQEL